MHYACYIWGGASCYKDESQTEYSGGNRSGGKTRIGANTPGDSGGSKRFHIDRSLIVKELAQKMCISDVTIIEHLFVDSARLVPSIKSSKWI